MVYSATVMEDGSLQFTVTWLELEPFMLSKVNWREREKHRVLTII